MEQPTPVAPAAPQPKVGGRRFFDLKNKWTLVALLGAVLIIAVVVVLMWVKLPIFSKLGVDVIHTEGTVEYRLSESQGWQAVPADLSLGEGAEVRTFDDSRAVLNIDDGSAVRLNANSSVKLTQLSADHVIVQNTGGQVYTRVVKSDTRRFEVKTDEATYQSQGTGYRTFNTDKREGVEVYHSKVSILGLNADGDVVVEQGEKYYLVDKDNPDAAGKVTELTAEDVAADSFMQWNSEEDKKDFSEELGVLFDLKPPALEVSSPASGLVTDAESLTMQGTTEAGAKILVNGADVANNNGSFETTVTLNVGENAFKVEAIDGAGNKTVKTVSVTRSAPAAPTPAPTTPAGITLYGTKVDKGVSFSWSVKGVTITKGFKLVKSTSSNPTYPGDDAIVLGASERSTTWKLQDGKTYYFRICAYNGSTCSNYSNNVKVTVPYTAPDPVPTGSLTLSHTGGSNVSWVLSGSAPYGYKLVWSNTTGPTYPGSSATFYEKTATSGSITSTPGTYYVRICMYHSSGCMNYSNEVVVAIP